MSLDPEALLGRRIGPYLVDRILGEGGFAWVLAARAADSGDPVALKVLKPRYAGDPAFARRFRREAEVAARLDHPHIARIREVRADGDLTYLAMDLYPDSLAAVLAREGPLSEDRLLAIAIQIAEALDYAHQAGVIHRDVKVDNVLLRADGTAVLTDFGIATAASGVSTSTGVDMTIGTPHYVSPEQAQGRPLDGRSDVYALGVTLYRAATGELPFRSSAWFELARMHVEDAPPPPSRRHAGLSRRVERVILRCLAKHPDDRYSSGGQLAAALRAIAAGRRRTSALRLPRPGRPGALTGLALLLVLMAVALMLLLARR
ncbi:MAG: serine/threonine protein kinase [Gemmatimonadota bacterium]|nr:serine/threonine protein kinase [Gemmatimonadota bacterium]